MYYSYKLETPPVITKAEKIFDVCLEIFAACIMRGITKYDRYKNKAYPDFKGYELGDMVLVKPKDPNQSFVFVELGSYDYSHIGKINKDGEIGWIINKERIYLDDMFGKYLHEVMIVVFTGGKTFTVRDAMYFTGVEVTKL